MDTPYVERVEAAAAFLRARLGTVPDAAVVLGSALGTFVGALGDRIEIPYAAIPHWPQTGVIGHEGTLVAGSVGGRTVAALAGRVHLYEGYDVQTVAFPARVVGRLGVPVLILTNAAGAINTAFAPGTLMVIDDHLNLLGANPLQGPNDERFGLRFPDMTEVYSRRLRQLAAAASDRLGLETQRGVYAAVPGPSYETPAEIRYLRTIGADAVGMSTVPEAIAARHMGLEVLGLSCIANMAAGVLPRPLHHEDVLAIVHRARGQVAALLGGVIGSL